MGEHGWIAIDSIGQEREQDEDRPSSEFKSVKRDAYAQMAVIIIRI